MLLDRTGSNESRHGRTFAQWLEELNTALKHRFRRNRNVEQRLVRAVAGQPLWDYWSSGYEPKDAAAEL